MRNFRSPKPSLAILALAALIPTGVLAEDSDLKQLREQLRLLEQKILVLERNSELKAEREAAAARAAPRLIASDGRFEIVSADGAHSLRLRGLVQGDSRWYDSANDPNDSFILRRARLVFEGRFNNIFQYVVQTEFAGTVQILDANVNVALSPSFQVRVGKFKAPVGLEQLQSDPVAFFNERSIATNLVPNRDLGIQFQGDVLDGALNYTLALLNGVADNGNNVSGGADFDSNKTVALRLFATPFAKGKESALAGLGIGAAVSVGDYDTASGRTSGYRTDGQQTFFSYLTSTTAADNVVADGQGVTFSPQAYYYNGPFGLLAEYVDSSIEVRRGSGPVQKVGHTGYNLSVGWVLTGETSTYRGVTPRAAFNPPDGKWGAFEIVARLSEVDIDDAVFAGGAAARLANPNTSASKLNAYGLGLNWHLSRSARVGLHFFHNEFGIAAGATPAANALIADDENTLITRLQVSF